MKPRTNFYILFSNLTWYVIYDFRAVGWSFWIRNLNVCFGLSSLKSPYQISSSVSKRFEQYVVIRAFASPTWDEKNVALPASLISSGSYYLSFFFTRDFINHSMYSSVMVSIINTSSISSRVPMNRKFFINLRYIDSEYGFMVTYGISHLLDPNSMSYRSRSLMNLAACTGSILHMELLSVWKVPRVPSWWPVEIGCGIQKSPYITWWRRICIRWEDRIMEISLPESFSCV